MRTMVKNGLQAIALSHRLALHSKLWTRHGLAQLTALALPLHTTCRRDESLELLTWLTTRINQLDERIAAAATADPCARLLLTHPGVGPLTALTTVLVLGPLTRFPDSKHVVSYIGLAPAVHASADKQRLGKITKQGNALLRWVLGQAAPLAPRADDDLRRRYFSVLHRRGRPKAKVRPGPQASRSSLHHAARPDRLRGVSPAGPGAATRERGQVTRQQLANEFPRQTFQCGRSRGDRWLP
jgi:transposase